MSNQIKQLEQLEVHGHKLSLAMESLIKISDAAMESLQIGGIHPQSYNFLQTSLAGPMQLAGFNQPVTSSLESFALGRNRLMATQVSLEGISEVLKKVLEMIVDTAQRIWQWVRTNRMKVLSEFGVRTVQVGKLKRWLSNCGDLEDAKDIEFEAELCHVVGEHIDARRLIEAVNKVNELSKSAIDFDKAYLELVDEQVKVFENQLKKGGDVDALKQVLAKKQPVSLPSFFKPLNVDSGDSRIAVTNTDDFERAQVFSTESTLNLESSITAVVFEDDNNAEQFKIRFNRPESERSHYGLRKKKLKLFSKDDIAKLLTAIENSASSKGPLEELAGRYDTTYSELKSDRFKASIYNASGDYGSNSEIKRLLLSLASRVGHPPLSAKVSALQHILIGQAFWIAKTSIFRYK